MDENAFVWRVHAGRIPLPRAAQTLGTRSVSVAPEPGTIEVETIHLNIQFLSVAAPGRLRGSGRIVKQGRDLCYLGGELCQRDTLVATATAAAGIRKL